MRRIVAALSGLAAVALLATPTATASTRINGPITTWQLEHTPAVPLANGPSTSTWKAFYSPDFIPNPGDVYGNDTYEGRVDFFPSNTGGFQTLRYSSKYLLLYNRTNGCMHVVHDSNGDWYNMVKCDTTSKDQRWSFPNGGQEIKASGDDGCIHLTVFITISIYVSNSCNASDSYQNFYWK